MKRIVKNQVATVQRLQNGCFDILRVVLTFGERQTSERNTRATRDSEDTRREGSPERYVGTLSLARRVFFARSFVSRRPMKG